ncbi:TPA: sugar phosphate isomerase/epimerase [Candidatus Poribacteria bacterium]|nr:sugar phosphate isomerase/epimerase [Candidatus Poribacteria bacterium]HIM09275.1 sugar phosphate isomerase/epimerase [Candidatus Poribacteria bacterium]HIN31416.1 sugar phosphate isomerase/epimerase [Candidatus Poribacteria bacterium]
MAKLGVIADGISQNFEQVLDVMNEFELEYAELQFLWDKEVGDLSAAEVNKVRDLVNVHDVKVSCISRHIFGGLPIGEMRRDNPVYLEHVEALRRCVSMAKAVDCPLVRVMSFRKEMILFGSHGANDWIVSEGAWDKLVSLMDLPIQIAEELGITLVVETGNNAMITSAHLACKLIDQLGTDRLKVLWDPCNSLYCNEKTYPDGYALLRGGYLEHIHIKDAIVDIPKATVQFAALNTGDMAVYLQDLANALRTDGYDGVISLESVYRPEGGSFEDGFRTSVNVLKQLFA